MTDGNSGMSGVGEGGGEDDVVGVCVGEGVGFGVWGY